MLVAAPPELSSKSELVLALQVCPKPEQLVATVPLRFRGQNGLPGVIVKGAVLVHGPRLVHVVMVVHVVRVQGHLRNRKAVQLACLSLGAHGGLGPLVKVVVQVLEVPHESVSGLVADVMGPISRQNLALSETRLTTGRVGLPSARARPRVAQVQ